MRRIAVFAAGVIAVSGLLLAQQAQSTTTVPRLVRISNTFHPANDSMLLNEVQRQQAQIEAQRNQLRELQDQVSELKALLPSFPKKGSD